MSKRYWFVFAVIAYSTLLSGASGCTAHRPADESKPKMNIGEGAIAGKVLNGDGAPFNLSLAGETPGSRLQIQLMSAEHAVVATVSPIQGKPQFVFSHVKPGAYELSVYRSLPGVRTIAGSEPVTVDAGQVTPVSITLQVTNAGEEQKSNQ